MIRGGGQRVARDLAGVRRRRDPGLLRLRRARTPTDTSGVVARLEAAAPGLFRWLGWPAPRGALARRALRARRPAARSRPGRPGYHDGRAPLDPLRLLRHTLGRRRASMPTAPPASSASSSATRRSASGADALPGWPLAGHRHQRRGRPAHARGPVQELTLARPGGRGILRAAHARDGLHGRRTRADAAPSRARGLPA